MGTTMSGIAVYVCLALSYFWGKSLWEVTAFLCIIEIGLLLGACIMEWRRNAKNKK